MIGNPWTVEIGPVEGPSAPIALDLEQLTKVINLLGQARAQMLEGQRIEPLDGKRVEIVNNPMWYIQVAKIDGSLLAFDHPAYGPIAFEIPRDDVAKIVDLLTNHCGTSSVSGRENQAEALTSAFVSF